MSQEIRKISIPLLLEYSISLPASPRIFARLTKLIQNDDIGLDYIASIIKMDPGLAAHILRVANSAYYGGAVKLSDIESAIARIGFNEVHKVLSVVIAHDSFYQALPAYGITATEYADECIAVAVACETVAKRLGYDMNAPYIAGLLHAIGKLAINLYLEKIEQSVDLSSTKIAGSLYEREETLLGLTSWKAGYELLKHWQFDPEIWQPIRQQRSPPHASSFVESTAILTLSLWYAQQLSNYDSEAEQPDSTRWALKTLHLDALDEGPLFDSIRSEFNDRQNLFSMLL
jgi:HD-like signal output (HDOD) protein